SAGFRLSGLRFRRSALPFKRSRAPTAPHICPLSAGIALADDDRQNLAMKQLAFFVCVSVMVLTFGCKREPELTKLYPVPDFSLIDQTGAAVTLAELKGKVWIADFIFTNCGGTCPMMTEKMRKLQNVVPQEIRMVSFSVDPDRDTTKVLAAYAAEQGATRDR